MAGLRFCHNYPFILWTSWNDNEPEAEVILDPHREIAWIILVPNGEIIKPSGYFVPKNYLDSIVWRHFMPIHILGLGNSQQDVIITYGNSLLIILFYESFSFYSEQIHGMAFLVVHPQQLSESLDLYGFQSGSNPGNPEHIVQPSNGQQRSRRSSIHPSYWQ